MPASVHQAARDAGKVMGCLTVLTGMPIGLATLEEDGPAV